MVCQAGAALWLLTSTSVVSGWAQTGHSLGGYRTGLIRVTLLLPTAEQWKPLNPEEKKRYDREFLLGFQFIFASMQKPEGLPQITDVVLDKVGAALEIGGAGGALTPLCALLRQGGNLLLCSGSCCSICNKP